MNEQIVNTTTNQFGDRIEYDYDHHYREIEFRIVYNSEYLKTVKTLRTAKSEIKKLRNVSMIWVDSIE